MKKVTLTVKLPVGVMAALQATADAAGISRSELVRRVLSAHYGAAPGPERSLTDSLAAFPDIKDWPPAFPEWDPAILEGPDISAILQANGPDVAFIWPDPDPLEGDWAHEDFKRQVRAIREKMMAAVQELKRLEE